MPLAEFPPATVPEQEEFVIIEEDDVPLGNLPQTGTSALSGIGFMGIGLAGLLSMLGGKKKEND